MMTRKHYTAIANLCAEHETSQAFIDDLCRMFQLDNFAFDELRFIRTIETEKLVRQAERKEAQRA